MDTHDLYGLPLDRFIPERTALAKQLRADQRKDDAEAVAALRKPSVAAWTVNQLIRSEPEAITVLFAAGDALREAQEQMLAGDLTPAELRDALERERQAIDSLLARADERGLSTSVRDRVADTLHAAALDEDARDQVQGGELVQELQHVGFGGAMAFSGVPPAKPAASMPTAAAKAAQRRAREEQERARRREAEEREKARAAARRVERDARAAAEAADRTLAKAQERHAAARAALDAAEDQLQQARADAAGTAAALREAEEQLRLHTSSA